MKQKAWLEFWDKCAEENENPIEAVQYLKQDKPLTKREYQKVVKLVNNYLRINLTDKVLEVGCGCGLMLNKLAPRASSVVGIDFSQQMIKKARKLFPDIAFLVGEAANIPLPSNYFERTFCFNIFAYFQNLAYAARSMAEFYRVTAPGGRILFGDIIKPSPDNQASWIKDKISHLTDYGSFIAGLLKQTPPLTTLTIEPIFMEEAVTNLEVQGYQMVMRKNPPYAFQEIRYDVVVQL